MSYQFKAFDTASLMQQAACDHIRNSLERTLSQNGQAGLLVSGGSSPRPTYEALSKIDIAWNNVNIGLVDERWVEPDADGSNAAFIAETLLQNKAVNANFIPMKNEHKTADLGAAAVSQLYNQKFKPLDLCIMGMGLDGHTASWFPNATDLKTALDLDVDNFCCAFDAQGCAVAGDYPERMTMTLSSVMSAKEILLLISGDKKRAVLEAAQDKSVYDAPVNALFNAGSRLTIYWGA